MWADQNKGDDQNPGLRSSWVGRDFNFNDCREDLIAGTPLLEATRILLSLVASQSKHWDSKVSKPAFIDIRKAYFHAPAQHRIYVRIPDQALTLKIK